MKISFLAIGNEILDGIITETNSVFIAEELGKQGLLISEKLCVRDTAGEILHALEFLAVSDMIIITGGIGPTEDDKTREAVASFLKRKLTPDDSLLEEIRDKFSKMNIPMPEENKNQAMVIEGSIIIPNPSGTAPGFIIPGKTTIAAFPGVPSELHKMFPFMLDYLTKNFPVEKIFTSVYLKTIGLPESFVDQSLKRIAKPGLTIGTIAHPGQTDIRLDIPETDFNKALSEAKRLVSCLPEISRKIFSYKPEESITGAVLKLLIDKNKTVMLAESCTGGLIAKLLSDIPGSSKAFLGSAVTYDNSLKTGILGVPEDIIGRFGAVSFETAHAMLLGINRIHQTDYSVSVTGIAGPDGGSVEKPVGTVFTGIGTGDNITILKFRFTGDRNTVRIRTAMRVMEIIWEDLTYGAFDPDQFTGIVDKRIIKRES